ncbi:15-hydroxyprostaglandin dehydrogenase [NAD(+)]-like [Daktulosphaira vitifoliae]|uniref:15-hydroxyprostaglandin dehydrogenase [NAD(+)]-like n=1 Tax=Daktulosphaira vitifoliae TaxID=58002 RepID=UPI0021AAA0B4|nr:15-hydroxyprostaglandin dehydrogenase [NAD(+)]-like [Daktulosphaira vitifoliae]
MILNDQVALVTGAASGIGYEYVKHLLVNGVKVAACDLNFLTCQKVVDEFASDYGYKNIIPVECDVTNNDNFENAFKTCIQHFGKLNIVVNNAGVLDNSLDGWEKTITINYCGVVRGTMLAIKYMSQRNGGIGGIVVQTASITALGDPVFFFPVYSSSKRAVVEFTRCIGDKRNFDIHGIRMMSICPGYTKTMLTKNIDRHLFWHEESSNHFNQVLPEIQFQEADHVGKSLIDILHQGKTGESWIVENGKPPKLVINY